MNSHLKSATPKWKAVANVFIRALATIIASVLVVGFVFLGLFLIVRGLGALLGAFLIGRHAFVAIAIMILLGLTSLVIASAICLAIPLIWRFRRNRGSEWPIRTVPHVEACLHFLGHQVSHGGGPLYSGTRATFRYLEVVDDVTLFLIGASQLASGESGSARLGFSDPAESLVGLHEGFEFDLLDRERHCICRGVISKMLGQD